MKHAASGSAVRAAACAGRRMAALHNASACCGCVWRCAALQADVVVVIEQDRLYAQLEAALKVRLPHRQTHTVPFMQPCHDDPKRCARMHVHVSPAPPVRMCACAWCVRCVRL